MPASRAHPKPWPRCRWRNTPFLPLWGSSKQAASPPCSAFPYPLGHLGADIEKESFRGKTNFITSPAVSQTPRGSVGRSNCTPRASLPSCWSSAPSLRLKRQEVFQQTQTKALGSASHATGTCGAAAAPPGWDPQGIIMQNVTGLIRR